jgi:hypothetical protein
MDTALAVGNLAGRAEDQGSGEAGVGSLIVDEKQCSEPDWSRRGSNRARRRARS